MPDILEVFGRHVMPDIAGMLDITGMLEWSVMFDIAGMLDITGMLEWSVIVDRFDIADMLEWSLIPDTAVISITVGGFVAVPLVQAMVGIAIGVISSWATDCGALITAKPISIVAGTRGTRFIRFFCTVLSSKVIVCGVSSLRRRLRRTLVATFPRKRVCNQFRHMPSISCGSAGQPPPI